MNVYVDVTDMQVPEDPSFNLLMQKNAVLQQKKDKKQKSYRKEKRKLLLKIVANSICFLLFILMLCTLTFSLNKKPVLQVQGTISEILMEDDEIFCIINNKPYELSKNLILGIDIPTSPRYGDDVAIYELNNKNFVVSPSFEYDKIIDATKLHAEMGLGVCFFSIFAVVFAFFTSINIRNFIYLKKYYL